MWHPLTKMLHIIDYKHGQGVVVEVERNEQLMLYALGVIAEKRIRPEQVELTIIQPRAPHPAGPIRCWTVEWGTLVGFHKLWTASAWQAVGANAPLQPGNWCRFCRAAPICPALHAEAVEVATQEFEASTPLPAPTALTQQQFLAVLEKAPLIEDYLRAVRTYAEQQLLAGVEVPGWKLVAKRAYRRWTDEKDAEAYLKEILGDDAYGQKLLSPAQAEKALKAFGINLPQDLVSKDSNGVNLVPDTDSRPALPPAITAAEDFGGYENGEYDD
jgi:Protein of unknown function (DUF2800)